MLFESLAQNFRNYTVFFLETLLQKRILDSLKSFFLRFEIAKGLERVKYSFL